MIGRVSIEWRVWLPDGWAPLVRDAAWFATALAWEAIGKLWWLLLLSVSAAVGVASIYGGAAGGQAARALAVAWGSLIFGGSLFFAFWFIVFDLIPRNCRVDQNGIAVWHDRARAQDRRLYEWGAITEIHVRSRPNRVARIEVRTRSAQHRIPVPRSIPTEIVVGVLEHWYRRPIVHD